MAGAPCLGYVAAQKLPSVRWATKVELYERLVSAQDFLKSHFQEGVSIADAARHACMSLYHFNRLFKALFGETPSQYVGELRGSLARRLLEETVLPAQEVAFQIGVQHPSSLTRICRKRLGCTPSQLRKANLASSEKSIALVKL